MLIVVVLVIFMVFVFVWKYCVFNKSVIYILNWFYFNKIEFVVWVVLIIIIVILVMIIWKIFYEFDLFKLFEVVGKEFIIIEVVFLDWKWLFIYLE